MAKHSLDFWLTSEDLPDPENRVTDHRIKLTVHQLDRALEGELDGFTEALGAEERRRALGE